MVELSVLHMCIAHGVQNTTLARCQLTLLGGAAYSVPRMKPEKPCQYTRISLIIDLQVHAMSERSVSAVAALISKSIKLAAAGLQKL